MVGRTVDHNGPMLRLRQIALVAADLEPVVDDLCATLDVEVCFRDPGVGQFGLRNALMPIGDTFLEVVSPDEDGTTAGRYLQRRGGDGGYMTIFQLDDLEAARARIAGHGIRVVWRSDSPEMMGTHLHPKDVPGAIVSLDRPDRPAEWKWAGPDWRDHVRTGLVETIAGAEMQCDDPERVAQIWSAVLDRPVHQRDGTRVIAIDDAELRFVPITDGRPEGLGGFDVRVAQRDRAGETHHTCGTRISFV